MKQIKVGVIGLGDWGERHVEAYRSLPNVEVVAVCSRRPERLDFIGKQYQIAGRDLDYNQLLTRDLDLVSVVTAESEHYGPVLDALRAGKHVLVEKPVSINPSEAREMWAVAAEHGRYLMPGHLLRFDSRYSEIYRDLQNGRIGVPVSIYLKRSRPKSLFATYRRIHTVYELTVHDLDLAIWYAGSRVKSVRAYGRQVQDGEYPDLLWTCLEFQNRALAILESNWLTPDEAGIAEADAAEVLGGKGLAKFDASNTGVQIWDRSGRYTPDLYYHSHTAGRATGALREQLGYICDCIAQGQQPDYVSFQDAVHGIEVCEAIVDSARTGQEVEL